MFPKDTNHSSREHVWSKSAPQEAESEMHPLLRETKQGGGGAVDSLSSHAGRCGERRKRCKVVRACFQHRFTCKWQWKTDKTQSQEQEDLKRAVSQKSDWQGNCLPVMCAFNAMESEAIACFSFCSFVDAEISSLAGMYNLLQTVQPVQVVEFLSA